MQIEKMQYSHFGECYRISNGVVELFATTERGPRIICYRLIGGTNILAEFGPEKYQDTDLGRWNILGGHRLWCAPEAMPRSYAPDNDPLEVEVVGENAVRFIKPVEPGTGILKEILVTMDSDGTRVELTHKVTNKNMWAVELAPWSLSIMNGCGTTIIPQEPFQSNSENLLPVRPVTLWSYTDMSDSRWKWGKKYIQLKSDPNLNFAQKCGVANKQGWVCYNRENLLFIKRFPYIEGANYVDFGCNFETYTEGSFMEVESLGALSLVQPDASVTHVENWYLFDGVDAGTTDESIDAAVLPLIEKTKKL